MIWLTVVGTLLGAVIGALATLAAQQINARQAHKQEQVRRRDDLRKEKQEEIFAYLESAQDVERMAGEPDGQDGATRSSEYHKLWTHHNRLSLICSDELALSLREFSDKLTSVLVDGTPANTPAWKYLQEPKDRFLRLASSEIKLAEQLSPADNPDTTWLPSFAGRSRRIAHSATKVPIVGQPGQRK